MPLTLQIKPHNGLFNNLKYKWIRFVLFIAERILAQFGPPAGGCHFYLTLPSQYREGNLTLSSP
jgi:hypothetical protein